ncbi:four-carbon acid sugar kinase family protein, partial [Polaribacter sp.]|uniref:four-carbon acid sugar kinase family protein n=1 Tax=Polaribacter sp. TaxID=1920175 RepID=UPI003F6B5C43
MITVIADDLTGAAEIAGICLRYGVAVSFGIDEIPEKQATINIIATDSRSKNQEEAYKTHLHLA